MELQTRARAKGAHREKRWFLYLFSVLVLLVAMVGPKLPTVASQSPAQVAPGVAPQADAVSLIDLQPVRSLSPAETVVTLEVLDATTGDPVPEFRYLINEDNTHENPSVTNPASYSPVITQGEKISGTVGLPMMSLPAGKYLATVLAGPFPPLPSDYKMWGTPFEVDGTGSLTITVLMAAENPLPLSTLRARVFWDNNSVDGEDNTPVEQGLEGFNVVIGDPVGEVTVDFYGNPICTEYDGVGGSTPLGDPIPGTGGECLTDADGFAVIPNLPPGKYEVQAVPPEGEGWIQTTTIEGTKVIDAWIQEGASGYSTEVGFLTAAVWFGFVRPCEFGDTADSCPTNDVAGSGTISGTVRQLSIDTDAPGTGVLGSPVPRPYVALNNTSGDDEQIYTARGNPDGTFVITDVPAGTYQLVYWDFHLDYIIQFRTVQVGPGETVDVGDIGIPRWFGRIVGYAYFDSGVAKDGTVLPGKANNGFRDCYDDGDGIDPHDVATCEPGIAGQDLVVRFKDGTIKYETFTDANGYYEFPEYFEWEHFLVWEVGFGRYAHVATTAYETDVFGMPIGYPGDPVNGPTPGAGGLLQAQLTWAGSTTWIDAGKRPYWPGENGGISGLVYYATTRNENDSRYAGAEPYEPGIPGVTLNLYAAELDVDEEPVVNPDGSLARAALLNTVETDAWTHPTNCVINPPYSDVPLFVDPKCLELPRTWNQVKDGVFDGGYAFENSCLDPDGLAVTDPDGDADVDGTPNKFDPDLLLDEDGGQCEAMGAGKYIVAVVSPENYKHIAEADINTDQGDQYVPAVPPPPCAGPLHLVDDPRSPYDGQMRPLCDSKYVILQEGFNAGAEFFLMTENAVPPPGYIRGTVLDDLVLQLNPASPLYVEKRGVPNVPVGILDFEGNEITRVYADEDGYWEVLLPSTYSAHCPTPGGICPAMYQVVGNYPGNPANPDPAWNPNYSTLSLVFDVWPGKTTYADVAIIPATNFVVGALSGFETPPVCEIAADTPDVQEVSEPYGIVGYSFVITGTGFGATQGSGSVTLDGASLTVNSWSDMVISVTIPGGHPVGAQQLLVTADNGEVSPTGLTYHVTGLGYSPTMLHVGATQPYTTVQAALDAAGDGDLVIVEPGTYYETIIYNKNVKLQGYGYGASVLDGRFFNFGGLTPQEFLSKTMSLTYDGPADVPMGQVLSILAEDGVFSSTFTTQIDGFAIRGGSVARGNIPVGAVQQGGGIYAHAYARYLEISNNVIQNNSGNTGGGIVLGQAYVANPDAGGALDNENDGAHIHHNRILNNGGFIRAGGVALFNGADDYEINHNTVCGNYSAEYGGGISHFGLSPGGHIHDNEVLFNGAFDEGGGVMIAGELNPGQVSAGTGDVMIERNRVQGNLSNDDGGGLRLLQPVTGPITITNNLIINNLATDAGGGLSLDDALDVKLINNTIAKNISTATAEDADRTTCSPPALGSCPHGAGMVAEPHSAALMSTLPSTATAFSDPVMYNNIFWENEAYYLDGLGGLPSTGFIDIEVVGTAPQCFDPQYSIFTTPYTVTAGCTLSTTNKVGMDPWFVDEVDTRFRATPFAGDPQFVTVQILSTPTEPQGDYHVAYVSPAIDEGVASFDGVAAPADDFDGEARPQTYMTADYDIGADEVLTDTAITGLQATNDSPTWLGQFTVLEASVDTGNNLVYTWDFGDGEMGSGASALHTYSSLGTYTAIVTATNSTGWMTATTQVEIVDAPILNLGAFNDGPTPLGQTTVLTALLSEGSNVNYTWDFGDGDTGSGQVATHVYPAFGDYTAVVTASNSISEVVASTMVVVDEAITGLQATNDSPREWGETTTLTATIATGSRVEYLWFFGDGRTGAGTPISHTYPAPGVYTAYATAGNSVSEVTASTTVTITDVAITGLQAFNDSPTLLNRTTTLSATVTTGTNVSYMWDFGDGMTGAGRVTTHIYTATGVYTAVVTATNSLNVQMAETQVMINAYKTYLPLTLRGGVFIP